MYFYAFSLLFVLIQCTIIRNVG